MDQYPQDDILGRGVVAVLLSLEFRNPVPVQHFLAFAVLVTCLRPELSFGDEIQFGSYDDASTVRIVEDGTPVLVYQQQEKSLDGKWPRAGYVHPMYDLNGEVFSEDFPQDHRHHRGVFWAWHHLSVGDLSLGDPWHWVTLVIG